MRPLMSVRDWTPSPATIDVLVALVVAWPTFMDAGWNQQGTRQADWITFTLAGVAVASLLWRRRWPLAISLVCGAVLTAWYLMDHHGELLNLPTMVGLYTVAAQGNRNRTVVVGAAASAWSGGLAAAVGSTVGSPTLEMLWPLVPLALGEAVRARRELLAEYAARAAQAEADREREARHRVEAEWVRIAREFHDVVAHTLAAVNVQMGVAVAAFDSRPDTARHALTQARASSKQALHELRATIALLRDPTSADPPTPAPRLTQIHDLAETTRAAGIAVTVHDGTAGCELPAAVELAGYRIVQEALTNVIRHAHARHAAVSLTHDQTNLVVEVTDDGTATPPWPDARIDHVTSADRNDASTGLRGGPNSMDHDGTATGHGLIGMAERAAVLGGRLEHGPRPEGGFRVRAVLPTPAGTRIPTRADAP